LNRRTIVGAALVLGLVATMIVSGAGAALAHEERAVGKYHFAVGFGDEPAYTGQKNSVQLLLADANDKPVVDLGDMLKVEVAFSDQKMDLTLEPNFEVGEFGTPGDYRAWFFPTRPGDYTFHFSGSIRGQDVDESFTSSPTTFSAVTDPTQVEFPAKDPTTAQLAQRVDREVPRLTSAIAAERSSAKKNADSAKTIGYLGLGVGALAVILAVIALATSRRQPDGAPRNEAARPTTASEG
jgi:hypothetical protein